MQPQDKKQPQDKNSPWQILIEIVNRFIALLRRMQQPQDKNLPFQLIHRFINFVKLTHRSESERESRNMKFSDNELVIILHLEKAATDLRCANPELLEQAKQILSDSPFVPKVSDFKRHLLACVELLLIEVKARQKNPELYDPLYQGTLWYFHNRDKLPKEVVGEIELYLAFGSPYKTPEEEQEEEKYFEEVIDYFMKRPLSVDEFIREKIQQLPDYERKDFLYSRKVKDWISEWHDEYCKVHAHVSMHTFQNAVSKLRKKERKKEDRKKGIEEEGKLRKKERKKEDRKKGIEEEELKKNQDGR